jgi:hypothetical protein
MSTNCAIRSFTSFGTRYRGVTLRPEWLSAADREAGDEVGLVRDDDRVEVRLDDIDETEVDATVPLTRTGNSVGSPLPPLFRHVLLLEDVGDQVYIQHDHEDHRVVIERPA